MKPLAILRNVLTWMSVLPTDEHTSKWQRVVLKIIPMLLISGILSSLTSSSVFFWKFVSIDLEVSLYALIQVMGQLNMFNIVVVTLLSRHKIQAMFSNLDNIFNAIKGQYQFHSITFSPRNTFEIHTLQHIHVEAQETVSYVEPHRILLDKYSR